MARFKGPKKAKDPFESIPEDWKDAVAASSVDAINARIAEVAKAEEENLRLKGEDFDLASLKEQVKEAGAQYSEATKMNRLKIRYAMRVLGDKGGDTTGGAEAPEGAE